MKLLIFLLLLTVPVAAQIVPAGKCTLKEPPAGRGIKLRMTPDEVQSVIKVKPERTVLGEFLKAVPEFSDVRGITFKFYEGKLASFTLFLNKATWADAKAFAPVATRGTGLPDNAWSFLGTSGIIKCDGFSMHINSSEPAISMTDEIANAAEKAKTAKP